jgi:signal transduction histidine kinase
VEDAKMKSIGLKLWSGMMILVVFMLILLWLFQIVFLENFYTSMRVSDIKNQGISIGKLLETTTKQDFQNALDTFAYNNNLSVEIMDLKENSIYTAGSTAGNGQMPMMNSSARVEAFQEVLKGKTVLTELTHPRFGNKFMLISLPVKISGTLTNALFINMPLAAVKDTTSILKKQLLYITVILLVAAIIISFIISKTLTKPILEMKRVSQKIASGDFSTRINSKNKDELGDLAETINHMGQELSKIDQLRKDIIANVSHELRTPLSIIRGYAETIKDVTGNNPEKREKQLGIIVEETERLGKLVDDILNLSQLQEGYLLISHENFAIMKTIDGILKRYDILSEKTGILLQAFGSDKLIVAADESKIEQVFYNLINNAFNHTKDGGTITIKVIDAIQSVKVEVTDTGTGISKEDLEHVWDRYFKAEKHSERKIIGTGLGLAIVKNVLEAHKVPYGVISEEGLGTTFWFQLNR